MGTARPECPYDCLVCGKRLQPWGQGMKTLNYACKEHIWQEADYHPQTGRWHDLREVPKT